MHPYTAEELRKELLRRDLSPSDLERNYGISAANVVNWMNGRRRISKISQIALNFILQENPVITNESQSKRAKED